MRRACGARKNFLANSYDARGSLTGLGYASTGSSVGLGYDALGRQTGMQFPGGLARSFQYNAGGRLVGDSWTDSAGSRWQAYLGYDGAGHRVTGQRERWLPGGAAPGILPAWVPVDSQGNPVVALKAGPGGPGLATYTGQSVNGAEPPLAKTLTWTQADADTQTLAVSGPGGVESSCTAVYDSGTDTTTLTAQWVGTTLPAWLADGEARLRPLLGPGTFEPLLEGRELSPAFELGAVRGGQGTPAGVDDVLTQLDDAPCGARVKLPGGSALLDETRQRGNEQTGLALSASLLAGGAGSIPALTSPWPELLDGTPPGAAADLAVVRPEEVPGWATEKKYENARNQRELDLALGFATGRLERAAWNAAEIEQYLGGWHYDAFGRVAADSADGEAWQARYHDWLSGELSWRGPAGGSSGTAYSHGPGLTRSLGFTPGAGDDPPATYNPAMRCVLIGVIAMVASAAGPVGCARAAAPAQQLPASATLGARLEALRAELGLPALAGAMLSSTTRECAAAGTARAGADLSVTVHSRFALASQTKAMTGLLIAGLVDSGALAWDTTAEQAFPELASRIAPDYRGLRLDELLAHTGGIIRAKGEPPWDWPRLSTLGPDGPAARLALAEALLTSDTAHPTRGAYDYSNAGYAIATAMAERATGMDWRSLLQQGVLAGLAAEPVYSWPADVEPRDPVPHVLAGGAFTPSMPSGPPTPAAIESGGAVALSVTDYARFVQLCLRGLQGGGCYSQETLARLSAGEYFAGWAHYPPAGPGAPEFYDHSGALSAGAYAYAILLPGEDVAVVLLANGYDEATNDALAAFAQQLAGEAAGNRRAARMQPAA